MVPSYREGKNKKKTKCITKDKSSKSHIIFNRFLWIVYSAQKSAVQHSINLFLALGLALLQTTESVVVTAASSKNEFFAYIPVNNIGETGYEGKAHSHAVPINSRRQTTILWEDTQ